MDIGKIDKNMLVTANIAEDVVWHDARDGEKFAMHGVFFEEESGEFLRLPSAVAKATSAVHAKGGEMLS